MFHSAQLVESLGSENDPSALRTRKYVLNDKYMPSPDGASVYLHFGADVTARIANTCTGTHMFRSCSCCRR